jgi:hypothetical protein
LLEFISTTRHDLTCLDGFFICKLLSEKLNQNEEGVWTLNKQTYHHLEWNKVKERIGEFALTGAAKEKILSLTPSVHLKQIQAWLKEGEEAIQILNKSTSVPIHEMNGTERILTQLNKG